MLSTDHLLDALMWIGGRNDGRHLRELDGLSLAKALIGHRAVGRALERDREKEVLPPETHQLLRDAFLDELGDNQGRCKALSGFLPRLSAVGGTPIIVKGDAAFQHSRNVFRLRSASDTDLIIEKPASAIALLDDPGVDEYKTPVFHEEVNLRVDGRRYDVHKHFPVWTREPNTSRTGETITDDVLRIREIPYSVLHAGARPSTRVGRDVLVPDATTCAFVQTVHMYRDLIRLYLGWTYHRTRVTAQELLDIHEFCEHPDFSEEKFKGLVNSYGANEQVRVAGSLILLLTGSERVLSLSGSRPIWSAWEDVAPLQMLLWYGFWVSIDLAPSRLFESPLGLPDLLGDSTLRGALTLATVRTGSATTLTRDQAYFSGRRTADARLEFELSEYINVRCRADFILAHRHDLTLYLSVGEHTCTVNFTENDARKQVAKTGGVSVVSYAEDINSGYVDLTLSFSKNMHERHIPRTGIVGLGSIHPGGEAECSVIWPFSFVG